MIEERKPRLMISQPMNGKSDEVIRAERAALAQRLTDEGYDVMDTIVQSEPADSHTSVPIYYLAKSIEFLAQADVVYFMQGWESARGCRIEHDVALAYHKIVYTEIEKGGNAPCQN